MKKLLLFALFFSLLTFSKAQYTWIDDSVVMGPGYRYDAYYRLKTQTDDTSRANNWDLAFAVDGREGSILSNPFSGITVYRAVAPYSQWATLNVVNPTDTATEQIQYNSDTTWYTGAFNVTRSSNPFDYGWGTYNSTSHEVNGDSIYLVKVVDGANVTLYKMFIAKRVVGSYEFRLAKIDGSNDTTITLTQSSFGTDRNFIYFSLRTKTFSDREPSNKTWDLFFTRYYTLQPNPAMPSQLLMYPTMGILTNMDGIGSQTGGAKPLGVAEARGVANKYQTSDYMYRMNNLFKTKMNEIGWDWKSFDQNTFTWKISDSLIYFVKSRSDSARIYGLVLTGFTGSGTGKVFFKTTLFPTFVAPLTNNPVINYTVYPNPANNDLHLVYELKPNTTSAKVIISDITGKVVLTQNLDRLTGFNDEIITLNNLEKGLYMVTLQADGISNSAKVIIQ